ncbi:hypothetical protein [Demequina pelophila]|uniref:hypothetical protein n=1 Tax=Demequina pelophila TaxID=1638984 RepID=UPI000784AE58|nr:hypothetical protein [Demequina pelophila]
MRALVSPGARSGTRAWTAAAGACVLVLAGCLGNDFAAGGLAVEKGDHGWLLAIEPDETVDVGLLGSNAHPDAQWSVVDFDDEVITLTDTAVIPPPTDQVQAPSGESNPGDDEDPGPSADPGTPRFLATETEFTFTGSALGTSPLRFELTAGGERIDVAEYTVEVVEDACGAPTAAIPNRCYDAIGFGGAAPVTSELDYGQEIAVADGASASVILRAAALHPDTPWEVTAYDDAVVAVDGPIPLGPARAPGDFSELDPTAAHSFLQAWEFRITGVGDGRTTLVLDLTADGLLIDTFEATIVATGG